MYVCVCMDGPPAQNRMTIFSNLLDETQDDIQTEAYNPLFALTKGLPTKRKLRHSHSMPKSCS